MYLRMLEKKDAGYMLEWMHDESVVENMQADFASKTMEDCQKFIENAKQENNNLHMAIADDMDVYQGTVSLKNITETDAEFAITIRKSAMGKGYSKEAMAAILRIGFERYNLRTIYWCVSPSNKRAIRFYDKNGYVRTRIESLGVSRGGYSTQQIQSYIWYKITSEDTIIQGN